MDGGWLSSRRREKDEEGGGGRLKKKAVEFSQYRHVHTASSSSEGEDDNEGIQHLVASKPVPLYTPSSPPIMMTIPRKPGAPPPQGGLHSLPKRKPALQPVPMGSGGRDAIKKRREELRKKQQEKEEQEEEERRMKKAKTEDEGGKAAPIAASCAAAVAAAAVAVPLKRGRLRRSRDGDSSDDDDDFDVLGGSTTTSSSSVSGNQSCKQLQEMLPAAYSDDDLVLMLDDEDSSREAEMNTESGGVTAFGAQRNGKEEKENEREKKKELHIMVDSSEDDKKHSVRNKKKIHKEVLNILDENEEETVPVDGGGSEDDDGEGEGEESEYEDEEGIRADKTVKACELISVRLMEEIRHWGQKDAVDRLDLTHMDDDEPTPAASAAPAGISSSQGQRQERASSQKTERIHADMLATACPGVDFKPYQLVGINWLFLLHQLDLDIPRSLLPEEAFQGRSAREPLRLNGVLADDMGLGKTAQTIAFLAYLRAMRPRKYTHLIIVPASVLSNWENEFEKFAPDVSVFVYHGSAKQRGELRAEFEEEQQRQQRIDRKEGREGGVGFVTDVILATYTYWEKETSDVDRKFLNKIPLEYMVLDEGHSIKNIKSQRFQRLKKQKAARRLLLTGTPLQNDVREVLALLAFLNPRILSFHGANGATVDGFWNSLVERGKGGGGDKEAIERLKQIFAPFVLRRLKTDVLDQLSEKSQVVEMVKMTECQRGVYESVTQRHFQRLEETANRRVIQELTLPVLMLPGDADGEEEGEEDGRGGKKKKKNMGKGNTWEEGKVELVEDKGEGHGNKKGEKRRLLRSADSSLTKPSSDAQDAAALVAAATSDLSDKDAGHIFTEWRKAANHALLLRRRFSDASIVEMAGVLHQTGYFGFECSVAMVQKELDGLCDFELHAIAQDERRLSHLALPMEALFDSCKCQRLRVLLPRLLEEGHRVLIFSTWTRVLDILGALLEEALQISFLRLDGQTPVGERQEMIDRFNAPGSDVSVFLLSTRAGGLGINLTSADTVILHDPDWNPSLDAQAVDRCHRIGQTKPVTVYRFVAEETVDERIYRRAVGKKEKTEALLESGGRKEFREEGLRSSA